MKHHEITQRIIGIFYEVYNVLGYGFLEKVYQSAMELRLNKAGLSVAPQHPIEVHFDGQVIGEYFADLVVEEKIIIELKAVQQLTAEHEAQLLHYLRATGYEVGLLLNFGPRPEIHRKVYDNAKKKLHGSDPPLSMESAVSV